MLRISRNLIFIILAVLLLTTIISVFYVYAAGYTCGAALKSGGTCGYWVPDGGKCQNSSNHKTSSTVFYVDVDTSVSGFVEADEFKLILQSIASGFNIN